MKKKLWAILVRFLDVIFFILVLSIVYPFVQILSVTFVDLKYPELISYIVGLFTLLFAAVTFYVATLRPFFTKPMLEFSPISDDNIQKSEPSQSEKILGVKSSWFVRIRISNYGYTTAKKCVGRLLKVITEGGKRVEKFDPIYLYWSRQSEPKQFRPIDIHGNQDSFFLDIVSMVEGDNSISLRILVPDGHRLIKDPIFPNFDNEKLPLGIYYLLIAIYGEETSIKPMWFKIDCNSSLQKPKIKVEKPNYL